MLESLLVTAGLMGLAGGPHCVAMCGPACAGMASLRGKGRVTISATSEANSGTPARTAHSEGKVIPIASSASVSDPTPAPASYRPWALGLVQFQFGRLVGYTLLGALASASMQGLGWLSTQSQAIRPFWTLLHVAAIVWGLLLVFRTQQPRWLDDGAKRLWHRIRQWNERIGGQAPLWVGLLWAFMPCSLLYSALLVATLAAVPLHGAAVMAAFALGSSLSLFAAPWLLLQLSRLGDGAWGMRLAGVALVAVSAWGLWMGLVHNRAPWCVQ